MAESRTERVVTEARTAEGEYGTAWSILSHWVESTRAIGNEPLTEVMENALKELEQKGWRAQEQLERAEEATRRS